MVMGDKNETVWNYQSKTMQLYIGKYLFSSYTCGYISKCTQKNMLLAGNTH